MKKVVILAAIVVMCLVAAPSFAAPHHITWVAMGLTGPDTVSVATNLKSAGQAVGALTYLVNNSPAGVLTSGTAKDSITAGGSATLVDGDVTQISGFVSISDSLSITQTSYSY